MSIYIYIHRIYICMCMLCIPPKRLCMEAELGAGAGFSGKSVALFGYATRMRTACTVTFNWNVVYLYISLIYLAIELFSLGLYTIYATVLEHI